MYEFLDAAIVRAPTWQPGCDCPPWPNLTGPDATPDSWRTWLKTAWQAPEFAFAVEAASPDLARQVARILERPDVAEAAVRRAVVSTLRYLLRAQTRATPFGLLAGIAPVRIGSAAILDAGDRHHVAARADAAWVAAVVGRLEADAALLPHLPVTTNNLAVRRGQRLVIEHRANGTPSGATQRVQVRATPPVLAALDAAEHPIQAADLAGMLAVRFPGAPSHVIDALIANLVTQRFLLTGLRPTTTDPDPLAAVLRVLDTIPLPAGSPAAEQRTRLHEVHAAVTEHNAAPNLAAARDSRLRAAALMENSTPLAIDLRLDWDLTIPKIVAAEAATVAGVMARLARRPALSAGWTSWHARFLERYGPGAVVPVCEAVDADTGLGYPAGYLGSPHAVSANPLSDRDKTLLKLAHTAAVRGDLEVVLDDEMINELSVISPDAPVQPGAEITVRVQAESIRDLDEGRFQLHVTGASRGVGTISGRFLRILDDIDRERMADRYGATPGVHDGAVTAQISAAPLHTKTGNVARSPRMSVPTISLGEYHAPGNGEIPLTDLAITADATRLHLVSISRQRPVHTILLNAVDLAYHSHPLTRFLVEASNALAAPCTGFEWGTAHVLPFLPALRYGRTILSPARWILTGADLPSQPHNAQDWDTAFAAWRDQVGLPDWAYLGNGDQCIRLHLTEPSHRALVQDQLRRTGTVMLRTAPAPHDLGWTGGRVHEIVIPVRATRRIAPVRWSSEVISRCHGYLPTRDGRLYLQLRSNRDQQDEVLTRHVPDLQRRLGGHLKHCWFIRYDHPSEQLRLRLALNEHASGTAIEEVSAWCEALRDDGLINSMSWETYYPETARFGGAAAFNAAEAFFAADSAAAIAQLTACAGEHGSDPRALTAASLVDIAATLIGDIDAAMHWLVKHTAADATPPPRTLYKQAVALANTCDIDPDVATAWKRRRALLRTYRSTLEQAGTVRPEELLPDLLHLHHARMTGPDLTAERACLHLARAAALSRIARSRKT